VHFLLLLCLVELTRTPDALKGAAVIATRTSTLKGAAQCIVTTMTWLTSAKERLYKEQDDRDKLVVFQI